MYKCGHPSAAEACRSLKHLPVAFTSAEQRVLAKFPMGGRTAVRYFQSTFTAAQYLANTVERGRELKMYSPRFADDSAAANATGGSGDEPQAQAEPYVTSPAALAETRQQILWAFVIVQELAADVPIDQHDKSGEAPRGPWPMNHKKEAVRPQRSSTTLCHKSGRQCS